MPSIEIECPECKGTGVYVGFAERNGAAVVCTSCKGAGRRTYRYEPFTCKKRRDGVKRVYHSNGFCISSEDVETEDGTVIHFSKYGVDYEDWYNNNTEPRYIEELQCPFQATGQRHAINNCRDRMFIGNKITECDMYCNKDTCWKLYHLMAEKGDI